MEHLSRVVDESRGGAGLSNPFRDYIIVGSKDGEICRVPNPIRNDEVKLDERALANAYLIAAAPELLLACQLLCALEDENVNDADTRWKMVRRDIREAIAKATAHSGVR